MKALIGERKMVMSAITQTIAALRSWSGKEHWIMTARTGVPALIMMGLLGYFGGWLNWAPVTDPVVLLTTAMIILFIPALLEELIFRGVLLAWLVQLTPRWGAWLSTLLFVAWHPLQALAFGPPWADLFLHPTFWLATLILGIVLAHVRIVSRSLWPPILLHWAAVLIWKSLLGGPFY